MTKILVADDDPNILKFITINLTEAGFEVIGATDGRDALRKLENEVCQLAVVDIMMPYMDGLSLIKEMRKTLDIPIIILTAKGQIDDKEKGFEAGTDDYLVKPFEAKELLFRIEALLRRYNIDTDKQVIQVGDVHIDIDRYVVTVNKKTLKLPLKEFELLQALATHPDQVFTREQLIDSIWGIDFEGDNRTVDVHIKRLRTRFNNLTDAIKFTTVRGVGYTLETVDT
ncbi:response regulator transcription factor [Lacicoccus qingdaonensis]|uniref:Heme response regulator HssR n=1 Tax=Lacicoccus qingdaonensis TaxID=576118 RepID=A0A1G9EPJ6_9BACL|nr:response regulator transcription factor [Salinicoccus qingdaonensis]SDK77961.1 DNA-binding response regulator, OmpR family, contains REC and winged-helix (wHTH) domain [Salinicoccus qingdaonensis]